MYKNNANLVFSCKYHIVWCTKYRKKILNSPIDKMLKKMLFEIASECRCEIIELEVIPCSSSSSDRSKLQDYSSHQVIKIMKGRTSRFLRSTFKQLRELPSLRTNSCFISTVGGAPLHSVKHYSENQKHVSYKKAQN
jgi:putative transposase